MDVARSAFLTFQGGGARGVAHIGGLRAVEASKLKIYGAAGTSAGAIIAALVAAGYSSEELLSVDAKRNLLQYLADGKYKSPKDLFTFVGWTSIAFLRFFGKCLRWARYLLLLFAIAGIGVWIFSPVMVALSNKLEVLVGLLVLASLLAFCYFGIAPLDCVKNVIDEAVSRGSLVESLQGKKGITFRQFAEAGGRPLKIVATNVSTQTFEVFSLKMTPDVEIADAVCASVCIPFIFKPKRIRMRRSFLTLRGWRVSNDHEVFVDGGLLSNLPIWVFDDERLINPSSVTIGFQLADSRPEEKKVVYRNWLPPLLGAVVNGPLKIHARGVPNLILAPLPTSLKLLDFNLSASDYHNAVSSAFNAGLECLDTQINSPKTIKNLLSLLANTLGEETTDSESSKPIYDVSLFMARDDRSQVVWEAFRISQNPRYLDDPVLLDKCVLGVAWDRNEAKFSSYSTGEQFCLTDRCDWLVAIPLKTGDPEELPVLVLVQSSDLPEASLESTLEKRAKIVEELFGDIVMNFDREKQLGILARSAQLWN